MDRPSKIDQTPAAVETAEKAARVEVQGVVLRPRGTQARVVVADNDGTLHCPRYRTHVRVLLLANPRLTWTFSGRKRSLDKTLRIMSEVSRQYCLKAFSLIGCVDDFFLFVTVIYVIDILVRFYGLGWRSFRANGWNIFDVIVASGSLITSISVRIGVSGYIIDQLQKLFLVSIAFKLVQRMNNLNKLFKTAVYAHFLMNTAFLLIPSSTRLQSQSTRHPEPTVSLARSLHLLRHSFLGGLQSDQVEHGRNSQSELHGNEQVACHACVHDFRVRTAGSFFVARFLPGLSSEGWNQYMHDL